MMEAPPPPASLLPLPPHDSRECRSSNDKCVSVLEARKEIRLQRKERGGENKEKTQSESKRAIKTDGSNEGKQCWATRSSTTTVGDWQTKQLNFTVHYPMGCSVVKHCAQWCVPTGPRQAQFNERRNARLQLVCT